jgi:hypothetical protein
MRKATDHRRNPSDVALGHGAPNARKEAFRIRMLLARRNLTPPPYIPIEW